MVRFYESICEFGSLKAKQAKATEFVTAQFTIPQGRKVLVSLRQGVQTNPSGTALDRVVTGLAWTLYLAELDTKTGLRKKSRVVPLTNQQGESGSIGWTFTGEEPIVQNLLLEPLGALNTVQWCATLDPATAPAAVTGVYGAIVGFLLPQQFPAVDLLQLLRQP